MMKIGYGIGIVIKSYQPKKNRIVLFDEQLGMIDAIALHGNIMAGSLIHYHLIPQSNEFYCLRDVELKEVPFDLARYDILFLHHLLELCYYFIPIGSCVIGVFDLLQFLYSADRRYWNSATQKLFIFRLLVVIGFYSTRLFVEEEIMNRLLKASLDKEGTINLAKQHEVIIGCWLRNCVSEHPQVQKFNTVHFLTRDLKI